MIYGTEASRPNRYKIFEEKKILFYIMPCSKQFVWFGFIPVVSIEENIIILPLFMIYVTFFLSIYIFYISSVLFMIYPVINPSSI